MKVENLCINCMREKKDVHGRCEYCGYNPGNEEIPSYHLEPFTILAGKNLNILTSRMRVCRIVNQGISKQTLCCIVCRRINCTVSKQIFCDFVCIKANHAISKQILGKSVYYDGNKAFYKQFHREHCLFEKKSGFL